MTAPSIQIERKTLTIPEVAEMLGLSRATAYRYAREGLIPTVRIGHKLLVSTDHLARLLDSHEIEPCFYCGHTKFHNEVAK